MDNRQIEDTATQNELLRNEVKVAREAAEFTADLIVRQFEETDRILRLFQTANAQRKAVLDSATTISIISVDMDGIIRVFNRGAQNLLGYGEGDVVGKAGLELFHVRAELEAIARESGLTPGKTVNGSQILISCVLKGNVKRREVTYLRKDGDPVPVSLTCTPLMDAQGEVTGLLCVASDITQRKEWERRILEAKESAEAANRTKSTFLANMSHELRTPLNAIIGYSEMLQEEAADRGLDDIIPDLRKINAAGKHLLSVINDVLDLSKIEAGKVELFAETFDFSDLVKDVVATVQPLIKQKKNALKVEIDKSVGAVYGDMTRIRQIMFNLLSNASKFTEGGTISMSASRRAEEGKDTIVMIVSDTGIGMTAEQTKVVFEAFTQADSSTTKKFGGTGLGLPITKKLCEMMGGSIDIHSEPNKGSTFTVRFLASIDRPPAEAPRRPSITRPTSAALNGSNTVLVIDDDPAVHDLLDHHLTREGFSVITASKGDEGIDLARRIRPFAITLDVIMPNKDGWAVLKELKSDPDLASIPVIMISIMDDKKLGFALGATEYLTKPVDHRRLIDLLHKYRPGDRDGHALVVEDDGETRELFSRSLKKEGWSVAEAENGREALERVEEKRPDVILLDLMMPVMDGFQFVVELRKREDIPFIPVVVVTAKDLTSEDFSRIEGNVQKILQKGAFSKDALLREIRNIIAGIAKRSPKKRET